MSKEYDTRPTIKLTPANAKELRRMLKLMQVPMSFVGFANFVLAKYSIPEFRKSQLFKDIAKPT